MKQHNIYLFLFAVDLILLLLSLACLFKYNYMRFKRRYLVEDIATVISSVLLLSMITSRILKPDLHSNESAHISFAFLTLALLNAVVISIIKKIEMRKNSFSQFSIKSGIDRVPYGLGFFDMDGRCGLINEQLDHLSTELTGESIDNYNEFWNLLNNGELKSGSHRLIRGDDTAVQLQNGEIWSFNKKKIIINNRELYQLTASNITDIFYLNSVLDSENQKRKNYHRQLRDYAETVDEYTRNKEILAAKVKIHDDLGRLLIVAQRCLKSGSPDDREQAINLWKRTVTSLRGTIGSNEESSSLADLIKAAEEIGVSVILTGVLPKEKSTAEYILDAAIHETLTNTVRHAGGSELYVSCSNRDGFELICRNNGIDPENKIIEGGGLSSLRQRVENAHGTMAVESSPHFKLTIHIPKENI